MPLFFACSSDDPIEPTQDYTSFVVNIDSENDFKDCITGYYTNEGICKKLGDLGDLTKGKISKEIKINIDTLRYIYIFYDLYDLNGVYTLTAKADIAFKLNKNVKNSFTIPSNFKGIQISKENMNQYPH
jgi:hypothetical protein